MNYNLTIIKNCGRLICLFLLYLMIFASIITVYEGSVINPVCLSGIPAILLFYLIVERYCYNAILYILLHLVPFGVVYTVDFPTPYYRYLYYTLLTAECLHSFSFWKSSGEKPYSGTPWGLFAFTAILYIISSSYKMTALSNLIYYCGVGLVMVHFFRLSVEGISNTLSQTQHATSVPTRKMILTSGITTGFTCLFFSIIAIAVRAFGLEEFLYDLGRLIIKINRIIFRFLSYVIAIIRALFSRESHIEDSTAAEEELYEALQAIHEPSLLAKIIDGILIIFALFVMLYLLYRTISYVVHIFFLHYAKDTDQIVPE
ncbi:MAG: hypothetical protein K2H34_05755 [Lachnospiraceae bacterium]|nr:hypothetical protein [Lachnospiraceae bacterium]